MFIQKGKRVKGWAIGIVMVMIVTVVERPIYTQSFHNLTADMPQLEIEETSADEQKMLETFQLQEQSVFWEWVYKIGGFVVARSLIMRQAIQKRYGQVKKWLRYKKQNKKVAIAKKKIS